MLTYGDCWYILITGGEQMLTRNEVAEVLKVHVNTIDRYVKQGMPCIKVASAVRFELDAVMEWLRNGGK